MLKYKKYKSYDWLYEQFIEKNLTLREISENIGVNINTVNRWIKNVGINKSQELIVEAIKRTSQERYGVDNVFCTEEVKQKIINTNLEKYGVMYPSQSKEIMSKGRKNNPLKISPNITSRKKDKSAPSIARDTKKVDNKIKEILAEEIKPQEIQNLIEKLTFIKRFNQKIGEYSPQFQINENLYLNIDSLHLNSELFADKSHHYDIREYFEANGKFIMQIREDELKYKFDIVKSILENKAGITFKKIFARKCRVEYPNTTEVRSYLKNSHLMGFMNSRHVALIYEDQIVSLFSFKIKNGTLKVDRFCSKTGTVVVGGFSKLLKHVESNYKFDRVHYWADLRYGTGNYLKKHGFTHARDTLGWKWTDGKSKTFNRLKCRANMDDRKLTQAQHAEELGWYKIYDAGQRLWIKDYT